MTAGVYRSGDDACKASGVMTVDGVGTGSGAAGGEARMQASRRIKCKFEKGLQTCMVCVYIYMQAYRRMQHGRIESM